MDSSKSAAAASALILVKKGMKVGLGTGSTARVFIDLLGRKNREENLGLECIATSKASERQAKRLGLKLSSFKRVETLDIAFDGADQVDSEGNLIKGMGGALVREKIVDYRAKKFVVMVGEDKLRRRLCGMIPVEVIPLSEWAVKRDLVRLGAKKFETRMDGKRKFVSDNSNLIIHAHFGEIGNPKKLEDGINHIAGVVDNGIFSEKKPVVIVGGKGGSARRL